MHTFRPAGRPEDFKHPQKRVRQNHAQPRALRGFPHIPAGFRPLVAVAVDPSETGWRFDLTSAGLQQRLQDKAAQRRAPRAPHGAARVSDRSADLCADSQPRSAAARAPLSCMPTGTRVAERSVTVERFCVDTWRRAPRSTDGPGGRSSSVSPPRGRGN